MFECEFFKVEIDGNLMIVIINWFDVMNLFYFLVNFELVEVFDEFEVNLDLWVVIVIGVGECVFFVGNDLKY